MSKSVKSVAFVDGEDWANSKAKKILTAAILTGKVKKGMKPKLVHQMDEEYMKWPLEQFRDNLYTLFRAHESGKLTDKSSDLKSILKNGGAKADDTTAITQQLASLGLLSGAGIPDDKTVVGEGWKDPPMPSISVRKPTLIKLTFPYIQFAWEDPNGKQRLTLIIHLPSGTYRDNIFGYKILGEDQRFRLYMDWSKFRLLNPDKFAKAFQDRSGNPLYLEGDTKMASYRRHIREKKGSSDQNPVKSVFEIPLDIKVKSRVTDAEGYDGFQIIPMGDDENPQLFCHVELMGLPDGHYGPKVDTCDDYCSSDDEDSSEDDMDEEEEVIDVNSLQSWGT